MNSDSEGDEDFKHNEDDDDAQVAPPAPPATPSPPPPLQPQPRAPSPSHSQAASPVPLPTPSQLRHVAQSSASSSARPSSAASSSSRSSATRRSGLSYSKVVSASLPPSSSHPTHTPTSSTSSPTPPTPSKSPSEPKSSTGGSSASSSSPAAPASPAAGGGGPSAASVRSSSPVSPVGGGSGGAVANGASAAVSESGGGVAEAPAGARRKRNESVDSEGSEGPTKLFVGQLPNHVAEEQLKRLFEPYGVVINVSVLRERGTGLHRGCGFVEFDSHDAADRAIAALHDKVCLHHTKKNLQVSYTGTQTRSVHQNEFKLFVGMLSRNTDEARIRAIFEPFGPVKEVYLMRDWKKESKGCAFVKYTDRDHAVAAMLELNDRFQDNDAPRQLVVRFAEHQTPRHRSSAQYHRHHHQPQQPQHHPHHPHHGAHYPHHPHVHAHPHAHHPHAHHPHHPHAHQYAHPHAPPPQHVYHSGHVHHVQSPHAHGHALPPLHPQHGAPVYGQPPHMHAAYAPPPPPPPHAGASPQPGYAYSHPPPHPHAHAPPHPHGYSSPPRSYQHAQSPYSPPSAPASEARSKSSPMSAEESAFSTGTPPASVVPTSPHSVHSLGSPHSAEENLAEMDPHAMAGYPQHPYEHPQYHHPRSPGSVPAASSAAPLANPLGVASPYAQQPAYGHAQPDEHAGVASFFTNYAGGYAQPFGYASGTAPAGGNAPRTYEAYDVLGAQPGMHDPNVMHPMPMERHMHAPPPPPPQHNRSRGTVNTNTRGPDGANLFVSNLPLDVDDSQLARLFAQFGTVLSAKVIVGRDASKSRGFGFVSFSQPPEAQSAIAAMNGYVLGDRQIRVAFKAAKSSRSRRHGSN